jgi:hypothetical protein
MAVAVAVDSRPRGRRRTPTLDSLRRQPTLGGLKLQHVGGPFQRRVDHAGEQHEARLRLAGLPLCCVGGGGDERGGDVCGVVIAEAG